MSNRQNFLNYIQTSKNFLLVKDSIGKPKPSTRALPSSEYTYGQKPRDDKESVATLLGTWTSHKTSAVPKPDKDFKKLNALSVAEKACTSSSQSKFRKSTDIRLKTASGRPRDAVPDMIFGTENRPSTPMKAVISNFYGDFAVDDLNNNVYMRESKKCLQPSRSTKGFDMRNEAIKATMTSSQKDLFKIKKYENVQPRTETRRSKRD